MTNYSVFIFFVLINFPSYCFNSSSHNPSSAIPSSRSYLSRSFNHFLLFLSSLIFFPFEMRADELGPAAVLLLDEAEVAVVAPAIRCFQLFLRGCFVACLLQYWEKAEFPFQIIPKLGAMGVAGGTIKGYGCPGLSIIGNAIAMAEVARVDASCSTFILVHSSLGMLTIALCGSEEQKKNYLPSLAQLKTVACWALTEPDNGSDASGLQTTATKVAGGWILEGQKRWIGNSTFADLLIIFARNTATKQINGYIVKKDSPGLIATKMANKIGLRMVQNGDIILKGVFV